MSSFTRIFGVFIVAGIAALGAVALLSYARPAAAPAQGSSSPTYLSAAPRVDEPAPALVVNNKCPMTGNAIDPAKVPANLIREFKGQKVGFCCPGCPPAWDKLTDAERQAKLDKVLIRKG